MELHQALGISDERSSEISNLLWAEIEKTDHIDLMLIELAKKLQGNELLLAAFSLGATFQPVSINEPFSITKEDIMEHVSDLLNPKFEFDKYGIKDDGVIITPAEQEEINKLFPNKGQA